MSIDDERNELLLENFDYEVVQGISPEVAERVTKFLQNEKAKRDLLPKEKEEERQKLLEYLVPLVLSGNDTLKMIEERADSKKSFAVFGKSGKEDVGVFIAGVTSDDQVPGDVFFGVAFDKTKKGVATGLVTHAHDVLRQKGIKEYKVSVWEASKKTIEKALGKQITRDPADVTGKGFIVKL